MTSLSVHDAISLLNKNNYCVKDEIKILNFIKNTASMDVYDKLYEGLKTTKSVLLVLSYLVNNGNTNMASYIWDEYISKDPKSVFNDRDTINILYNICSEHINNPLMLTLISKIAKKQPLIIVMCFFNLVKFNYTIPLITIGEKTIDLNIDDYRYLTDIDKFTEHNMTIKKMFGSSIIPVYTMNTYITKEIKQIIKLSFLFLNTRYMIQIHPKEKDENKGVYKYKVEIELYLLEG